MKFSRRVWLGAAATFAALSITGVALAGATLSYPTWVFTSSSGNSGEGSLGTARYSSDEYQNVGCEVEAPAGSSPSVYCWAVDSSNDYVGCTSTDANIVATARMINATSNLYFSTSSTNVCTYLTVENSSTYIH